MRKFCFDLDGTLTKVETLPLIAEYFGITNELHALTAQTINGQYPFVESFIKRVNILKPISVRQISILLESVALFQQVLDFISANKEHCAIVSGNLDCYIKDLAKRIGVSTFCSKASVVDDRVVKILSVVKKAEVVREFQLQGFEVVFIGDGDNDADAMRIADIKIASGLVHKPSNSVLNICDYVIFEEGVLCRLLKALC